MNENNQTLVPARQDPLRGLYLQEPDKARITDAAKTSGGVDMNPFHGQVHPGNQDYGVSIPIGIHQAVGGYHDAPNPGDLLCAALASCLDSTIRIIADRLGVALTALEVEVTAEADVRGTLMVARDVPVAFTSMQSQVNIQAAEGTDSMLLQKLLGAAEHSCINLQTLRAGVEVTSSINTD